MKRLVLIAILMGAANYAWALPIYTTELTYVRGGAPASNRVVMTWQTHKQSGLVTEADLLNWKIELFDGPTLLFTDTVIVNGAVQQIAGIGRLLVEDLIFNFSLDAFGADPSQGLTGLFDNDFRVVQQQGTQSGSPPSFNIFTNDGVSIILERWVDVGFDQIENVFMRDTTGRYEADFSQVTRVPAPAATGLLVLLFLSARTVAWALRRPRRRGAAPA